MTDSEVNVVATEAGAFVMSREGHGSITLEAGHIINLSQSLPRIAHDILQELHGPKSSNAEASTYISVKQFAVRRDLLGAIVQLHMKDTLGNEYSFGFPPMHAHEVGDNLTSKARELMEDLTQKPSAS